MTQNYTHIWCDKCQDRTILEPGKAFDKLNCKCEKEEEHVTKAKPRATHQAKRKSETE